MSTIITPVEQSTLNIRRISRQVKRNKKVKNQKGRIQIIIIYKWHGLYSQDPKSLPKGY